MCHWIFQMLAKWDAYDSRITHANGEGHTNRQGCSRQVTPQFPLICQDGGFGSVRVELDSCDRQERRQSSVWLGKRLFRVCSCKEEMLGINASHTKTLHWTWLLWLVLQVREKRATSHTTSGGAQANPGWAGTQGTGDSIVKMRQRITNAACLGDWTCSQLPSHAQGNRRGLNSWAIAGTLGRPAGGR